MAGWFCEAHQLRVTRDCPKCDDEQLAMLEESMNEHTEPDGEVIPELLAMAERVATEDEHHNLAVDGTKVTIGRWIVRIVREGDNYGATMSLTHDKPDPLVEFYDTRHPTLHVMGGQFVSRYYASTLLDSPDDTVGLSLNGGVPEWTVDASTMRDVRWFIRNFQEV